MKEDISTKVDLIKPAKRKSNLTKDERQGLKWILDELESGEVRVVQADKGGALCIVPKSYMKRLEEEKLNDTNRYEVLGEEDPTEKAQKKLYDLWRKGEDEEHVNREECKEVVGLCEKKGSNKQRPSTSSTFKPGTPYFYGLLKVHKFKPEDLKPGVDIPIRLVTDLSRSVTSRSDKFINWKFLQPLQEEFCKDLARDSTEVVKWLEQQSADNKGATNIHGFAWDFCALYDNLTPTLVLKALETAMTELRPNWSPGHKNWLLDLVKLSLNSSFARHGSKWFRSILGIPTGGSLSVTLANIAVFYAMRDIIFKNRPDELLAFKRFVDDIGGLWKGCPEKFKAWSDEVNKKLSVFGLSIKDKPQDPWDINKPGDFTVFLDIKYTFDDVEGLLTDVNIKPTDARVYLNFSSYHPSQTFPSIVYSQALRYKRIINRSETLKARLDELELCFIRSGYPKKMVHNIMLDVLKRERSLEYKVKSKKAPFPVAWVQTFSPSTSEIKDVVRDANKVIKLSPPWKDDDRAIGIVNKRGNNIGDLILKRKKFALMTDEETPGTKRCSPILKEGEKRSESGRPCASCDLMSGKKTIKSFHTGRKYATPPGTCKSQSLIYAAECRLCHKQYVGQTTCMLRTRISGHRAHVNKKPKPKANINPLFANSDESSLADHLKTIHGLSTPESFNSAYSFTIIHTDPADINDCEQTWVSRLGTMQPFGLNTEKPCGVADSFFTMSQKASDTRIAFASTIESIFFT